MTAHHHAYTIPLGPCDHVLEHGRYGFAFGCACGSREHRWLNVRLPVADKELWWLQPVAVSEEERAAMVEAERAACKVLPPPYERHTSLQSLAGAGR